MNRYRWRTFGLELVMVAAAAVIGLPVYVLVNLAVRAPSDTSSPIRPTTSPTLSNFTQAWEQGALGGALINSTLVTVGSVFIVLVVSSSLLVFPTSVTSVSSLTAYQHWLGFGVALLIAAACVAAQYLSARVSRYRLEHGYAPLLSGDAGEDLDDVRAEVADRELVAAG